MIRTLVEVDTQRAALQAEHRGLRVAREALGTALRHLPPGSDVGTDLQRARTKVNRRLGAIDVELSEVAAAERRLQASAP